MMNMLTAVSDADPGGGANRTLVLTKEAADTKGNSEVEEDLNVMARILDKAANGREERGRNAMGLVVHGGFAGSAVAPRNLYLEGYGALFFLGVNYPLVPNQTKKVDEDSKEEANGEWEEARRELSQPPGVKAFNFVPQAGPFMGFGGGEEYDAEKVEKLKSDLISSLKNASHIRRLKSDENITVVVSGRGDGGPAPGRIVTHHIAGGRNSMAIFGGRGGPESPSPRLILRVKKSEVEAFQRDKTSLEDFRKRVSVAVY
jgi:hypothetical protein